MSTWTDRARLYVKGKALLLDLGRPIPFYTESGPKRARYLLVGRLELLDWFRLGLPRAEVLHYPLPIDPLDFSWEGGTLVLPGLRVYLEGPPEFVETPYWAWPLDGAGPLGVG